jgi:hypothetical protein
MHGRVDLDGGAEEREVADPHRAHVQHHAVEVEEDSLPQIDVGAVIAEEGRLQRDRVATRAEQLAEDAPTLAVLRLPSAVQRPAEVSRPLPRRDELGVQGIVRLPGQHFQSLGLDLAATAPGRPHRHSSRSLQESNHELSDPVIR